MKSVNYTVYEGSRERVGVPLSGKYLEVLSIGSLHVFEIQNQSHRSISPRSTLKPELKLRVCVNKWMCA